jgi:hypothetical protein
MSFVNGRALGVRFVPSTVMSGKTRIIGDSHIY